MRLRTKTLLAVGLTMLTLYVLLLGGAYLTLRTRLGAIESQEAKMIASRAADAVSAHVAEVEGFAASLGARDSTYEYAKTRDSRLIAEEMSEQTLIRRRLDFVVILDESGAVRTARAVDLDLEVGIELPADLIRALSGADYLQTPGDPRGGVAGLMRLPKGMAIVAARPVTTRDQYSVPKGTVIVGRYLNVGANDRLSQVTGLDLTTQEPPAAVPEDAEPSELAESDQAWQVWWRPDDSTWMSSYALAAGIRGEPALLVRAVSRRVVNESFEAALAGAAVSLLLVCVAATFTVFVMIDWAVVGPLSRLSEQVRGIEPGDESLPRVQGIEGGELGELAESINVMLESLESAEQDLRESRHELEVRVETRTKELQLSEMQHRELVERLADAVFSVDRDGVIKLVNERAAELLGRDRVDLVGTLFETLVAQDHVEHVQRLLKAPRRGDTWTVEAAFVVPDRDPVPVELRASAYTNVGGEHVGTQWIARDITERQRFEQQLIYLANHDALTGMANRRAFESALERELAEAMRKGVEGAVLWLDLDDFKDINDTLGHRAGDETLVQLSTVLTRNLRGSNLAARVGGDEFAILMPRVTRQEAEAAAERILSSIVAFTFAAAGRSVRIGASVGVVFFPEDGSTVQEVLSNADAAMYRAKDGGRSMVYVSEHRQTKQLHISRMTWNDRLNKALATDDFVVCAQPIMDLRTNSIRSHELLIRMRKGDDDVYPPSDFLPVAERLGLITEIDHWMLRRAVTILESEDSGLKSLEVNLSGKAFSDAGLLQLVADELARSGVDPSRLGFEITETAAIADMSRAQWLIRGLKELGCRFSLDDFGTGFSSFYYLKHLPVDCLKVDGSYVRGLAQSEEDRCLVRGILEMCRGLGVEVLAECVEDEDALRVVTELGMDYAQGYHIGRPVPIEEAGLQ